jgi:sec-independent protein translocase protein TatA
MGFGGISVGQLLLIALLFILLFGTKRLAHFGKDLGSALRSFKEGLESPSKKDPPESP